MTANCLIVTGEKSGEEHCLSFFQSIRSVVSDHIHFWGVGGDHLKREGMELLYHINDFSSWGYSEVLSKIPFYMKAMNRILDEVQKRNTKIAILVDFQTFNLKLAQKLSGRGVRVLYYVAPQAWAWKSYRVKKLQSAVHTLFTIIPFEKHWFESRGVYQVKSVPHPVWLSHKDQWRPKKLSGRADGLSIVLLPGSRHFEVHYQLPVFLKVIQELRKRYSVRVSLVQSPSVKEGHYEQAQSYVDNWYLHTELDTALKNADFALASSGTVTLTCALYQVPTVVCYKSSLLNEFIYRTFVSYDGPISLANIIFEKVIFPELIQDEVSEYNILKYLDLWLSNRKNYENTVNELGKLPDLVSGEIKDPGLYIGKMLKEFSIDQ